MTAGILATSWRVAPTYTMIAISRSIVAATARTSASRHPKTRRAYHRILFCRFCHRISSALHNVDYQQGGPVGE
jgi:hypothetical protein